MTGDRLPAAALAACGALSGIPLALAQLDFAGIVNVFGIDTGDVAHGLLVLAAIGGVLTCVVILASVAGAALCLTDPRAARSVLLSCALGGFLTSFLLWLPPALAIAAAAHLLDAESSDGSRLPELRP